MKREEKILVTGATGLVGSAIVRNLQKRGYKNIIGTYHKGKPDPSLNSSIDFIQVDLTSQSATEELFSKIRPDWVVLSAARVGGIIANSTFKADFIYQNMAIALNVIHSSYKYGIKKLLNLGSSCIYPKFAPQPMKEDYLLTGTLEATNEPYAIAKISAIKLCRYYNEQYGTNFFSVMPTNLYGPRDNFDLINSHVLPALIRKFHLAKLLKEKKFDAIIQDLDYFGNAPIPKTSDFQLLSKHLENFGITADYIELWGTGEPYREFLYVDDLADACGYLMESHNAEDIKKISPDYFINIGTGEDIKIKDLANLIKNIINYEGDIKFDKTKPDGTPKKLLDVSKMKSLGWQPQTPLEEGIKKTYNWYLEKINNR